MKHIPCCTLDSRHHSNHTHTQTWERRSLRDRLALPADDIRMPPPHNWAIYETVCVCPGKWVFSRYKFVWTGGVRGTTKPHYHTRLLVAAKLCVCRRMCTPPYTHARHADICRRIETLVAGVDAAVVVVGSAQWGGASRPLKYELCAPLHGCHFLKEKWLYMTLSGWTFLNTDLLYYMHILFIVIKISSTRHLFRVYECLFYRIVLITTLIHPFMVTCRLR